MAFGGHVGSRPIGLAMVSLVFAMAVSAFQDISFPLGVSMAVVLGGGDGIVEVCNCWLISPETIPQVAPRGLTHPPL